MKKVIFNGIIFLLLIFLVAGMVACNKNDKTNPDLLKVKQAFDGVEQSMDKGSSAKNAAYSSGLKLAAMTEGDALSAVRNVYSAGDRQSNNSPEISYDQPPMRQFQYLKAIFDEMGDDYELGTKYYYDITGQMYFDMETGYRVETKTAEYLYNYVFGFALSVELKENDLIFAEVGFTINLTHASDAYKTSWYVSFDLNYDFNDSEPTYTLLMYTDNKEGELEFLQRDQGYEYDYVQMEKGAIKEWRKFVMDADRAIVIDSAHPSFDSYVSEGIVYRADTAKWLKNGEYYKITQMNDQKKRTLATAFVDGLGMNSTSINAAAFLNKEGKQSAVIDTYYKKICQVYGDDVIYDLVCKKEDPYKENGNGGNGGDNGNENNGNNNEPSTANWQRIANTDGFPSLVPAFSSVSANFRLTITDGVYQISVSDPGQGDYRNYHDTLLEAGFLSQGNGTYYLLDEENGKAIVVSVSTDRNMIVIALVDAQNSSVKVPNGINFFGDVSSMTSTGISFPKDITGDLSGASSGAVTTEELTGLVPGQSYFINVSLAYEQTSVNAEDYAYNVAKEYGGQYAVDKTWTCRYNNTVNFKQTDDFDVIIVISSGEANNQPHLYIYALAVESKTADLIIDGDFNNNGNNNDNGNTGENDNNGENGNTDDNDDNNAEIHIALCFYNEKMNFLERQERTFEKETVGISELHVDTDTYSVYRDEGCSDLVTDTITIHEGMVLYLKPKTTGNSGENSGAGNDQGNNPETEPGKEPGEPGSGGDENGNPEVKVSVSVTLLDKYKNVVSSEIYSFNDNQVINVSQFITENGQQVYLDSSCSQLAESSVRANAYLVLYVWKELPQGTFTIYNVTNEGTSLYTDFQDYIGDGVYFGYSFDYILYWNEGCTDMIPIDYNFDLTEEGITVYRHIYEDYFALELKCYVNGHLWQDDGFSNSRGIYRKGKVYNLLTSAYGQSIVDFDMYRSWLGTDIVFYLGEGRTEQDRIDYGSKIATVENKITIYIYANNPNYHVYTLKTAGGDIITEDYVCLEAFNDNAYAEGMGNIFEFKNKYAEYCIRCGNEITMYNVHTMYTLTVLYTWNGRVLTQYINDTYFTSESCPSYNGPLNEASDTFFTDINCTIPIRYTKDIGEGNGEYPITTSTTLYTPYHGIQ